MAPPGAWHPFCPFAATGAGSTLAALAVVLFANAARAVPDPCVHEMPLALVSRFGTGARPASAPAIGADGTAYLGTSEGYLHAFGPEGAYRWGYTLRSAVVGDVGLGPLAILVPTSRRIDAIRLDGTLLWSFESPVTLRSGLASDGAGRYFFSSEDGRLFSITSRGALMHVPGRGGFSSPPVRLASGVGIGRNDGTAWLAFGFRTRRVPLGGRASELFACPGADFCALLPGEVLGVSAEQATFRYSARRAAAGAGRIAVVSDQRALHVYARGQRLFTARLVGDASAAPLVDPRGRVYVPLESGALEAFAESGRTLGCVQLADSPLGAPVFDALNQRVWVTAREGVLAAVEAS